MKKILIVLLGIIVVGVSAFLWLRGRGKGKTHSVAVNDELLDIREDVPAGTAIVKPVRDSIHTSPCDGVNGSLVKYAEGSPCLEASMKQKLLN